jgi:hypothetical protein
MQIGGIYSIVMRCIQPYFFVGAGDLEGTPVIGGVVGRGECLRDDELALESRKNET